MIKNVRLSGIELQQDMCVFDIIAMNDLEAGDVHGAF